MLAVQSGVQTGRPLPRLDEARELFARHLPCDQAQLRRAYLRLALQYHPDKRSEDERLEATQLFQAIAAAYEELLKGDGEGEQRMSQRVKSPVAAAAELGELQELRRLLEERPEAASEPDDLGVYPLMFAAVGGCIEAAEMLLEFGADLHAPNPIKWSALLYAALGNHAPMVRYLVSSGATVTDHELILTAYTGNPESLEALLDLFEGSPSEVRTDTSKKTLLHLACEGMCFLRHSAERHAACVETLLRRRVPVEATEPKRQRTCLQDFVGDVRWRTRSFESSRVHLEAIEKLCVAGASVTSEDAEGGSAISIAADMGLMRVREVLFAYV